MQKPKSLIELYKEHRGKVSDKWELYLRIYEEVLSPYRDRPINLLEMGIQNGGSLEIWSEYFHKDSIIVGIDIDEKCKNLVFDKENIKIIIGNACNVDIGEKIKELGIDGFDIIIDDGSHLSEEIIKSFCNLFPYLKVGGIYIIEDLHCSYWEPFGGGLLKSLTAMEFLKLLADILNHEHWRLNKPREWLLRDFIREYNIKIDEMELAKISSIIFYNSLCIIKKDRISRNKLGSRVVVGKEAIVSDDTTSERLNGSSVLDISLDFEPKIYPTARELQLKISELEEALKAKEEEVESLKATLDSKEGEIRKLTNEVEKLRKLNEALKTASEELTALRQQLNEKDLALKAKEEEIKSLKATLVSKESEIKKLNEELIKTSAELESIKSSVTWRAVMKWHSFIEKVAPLGTRRRRLYDLGIIGLRTIANEGFLVFLGRTGRYISKRLALKKRVRRPLLETNMPHLGGHEPLKLDKELKIIFRAKADKLNEVKILTATYQRRNEDLELLVEVDGKLERRVVVKGWRILDNDYTSFKFKPIENCDGKIVTLRLKSLGEPSSAVWFNRHLNFSEVELFYDGKKIDGSINIQVYHDIKVRDDYELWILKNEPKEGELKKMAEDSRKFKNRPKISIIMPVWNTEEKWLRKAIESVLNQVYDNWELCIADGGSTKPHVRKVLEEYARKDERILRKIPKSRVAASRSIQIRLESSSSDSPHRQHARSGCVEKSRYSTRPCGCISC